MSDSISAFGAVSFVEAAIFLVAAGVIALLLARADERPFHLPGGDGTVIFAAGLWATALIFYRVFDRPDVSGEGGTVGIQWGFFVAFVAAGALAFAGQRIRVAGRPEPRLPAAEPDVPPPPPPAPGSAEARSRARARSLVRDDVQTAVVPRSEAQTEVVARRDRAVRREDARRLTFERRTTTSSPTTSRPLRPGRDPALARRRPLMASSPTQVADGVWRLTRGFPLQINVFLVREDDGVAVFDAGHKPMGPASARAADALGGATRVILGNAHADHRGGANAIGAPIHCHPDERADVEGDGGAHYFDSRRCRSSRAPLTPRFMRSWDDGPLRSPARSPRATASATSRSSTCPATRRAASACGASPTAWRSPTTASRSSIPRSRGRASRASRTRRSTGRPSAAASRSRSSPRSSRRPAGRGTSAR